MKMLTIACFTLVLALVLPEMALPALGAAEAKGAGKTIGKTMTRPQVVVPRLATGGQGGGRRPPVRKPAGATPSKPPKLTPIFNRASGATPPRPPRTDKPVPRLHPPLPKFTPPGI